MLSRMFRIKGHTRAGVGSLAAALLLAAPGWAQGPARPEEERTLTPRAERTTEGAARTETRDAARAEAVRESTRDDRSAEGSRDPEHQAALRDARERVEVLDAQLGAKRAHIRLAEARFKHAQDQLAFYKKNSGVGTNAPVNDEKIAMLMAEIPVLQAERDAELAEVKEPEILLKGAREDLEQVERHARMSSRWPQGGAPPNGYRTFGGMAPMEHPLNVQHHLGMMQQMHMQHSTQLSSQLEQLRQSIENLSRDVDGLKRDSKR